MNPSKTLEKATLSFPLLLILALACPWTAGAAVYPHTVANVGALNYWLGVAESDPENQHHLILTSTTPYVLTKTLKVTKGRVTIKSPSGSLASAHQYVLDGGYPNGSWRQVFVVSRATSNSFPSLYIQGVTIKGGAADGTMGGALYVHNGFAFVSNSYIQDNISTRLGSGVYVDSGEVFVINCVVRNNKNLNAVAVQPFCGGLMASGGGLAAWTQGNLWVYKSTVMGNHACRGGGIAAYPGSYLTVENSTFSDNTANLTGGGIFLWDNVSAAFKFNTITHNKAGAYSTGGSGFWDEKYGGGIALTQWYGNLYFVGNILAKNETVFSDKATLFYHGHDCFDRFGFGSRSVLYEGNFIGARANCSMFGSDGWWHTGWEGGPVDPLLDPLTQKTGAQGPQYTRSPKSNSPVIGNYRSSSRACTYDDQLSHRRDWYQPNVDWPMRCDMGAHQYNWFH